MQDTADKLITVAQAAMMLEVSKDTIRRMMKRGKLSSIELDGVRARRTKLSDVLKYITNK